MLLSREKEIVRILLENQKPVKSSVLALQLNVSKRTITSSVQKLKSELPKYGSNIISRPSVGIWLECETKKSRDYLVKIVKNQNIDDEQYRKNAIAIDLLESDAFQSIETIAHHHYYSSSAIYRDLNDMEDFFVKYNLILIRKAKVGIKLVGSEKDKRIAKAELIKMDSNQLHRFDALDGLDHYFEKEKLEKILKVINSVQASHDVSMCNLSLKGLVIHIAITLNRITNNQVVELSPEDLSYLSQQKEWEIAEELVKELKRSFNVDMSESENGYVTIHLMGANLFQQKLIASASDENVLRKLDEELYVFLERALAELQNRVDLYVDFDDLFINTLFLHLKPMINRLQHNITLFNPFVSNIKQSHPLIFEIAVDFSNKLSMAYDVEFNDDEIGYIALHFGAAFERSASQTQQIKAVLVCASGLGTSQFLKARIHNEFPRINVVAVIASMDIKNMDPKIDYDVMISTVPVEKNDRKTVYISPMLLADDIKKIKRFELAAKQGSSLHSESLLEFMSPEISIFQGHAETPAEAITDLSVLLYEHGYVDGAFAESVIMRERLSSTAVGNLIAIPHAFRGHVLKQGIGILVNRKAIDWDGTKVQIIFMLSTDIESSDRFMNVFTEINALMHNIDVVENILKTSDFKQLVKILK